jgi:dsDNA-binding SOS-regulon protein
MAVIVKYVVERNGVEKMTFTAKSEADAYDKMLDMADDLFSLLAQSQLFSDEQQQENLAFYLAQHKDELLQAVGAKAKTVKKEKSDVQSQGADVEAQSGDAVTTDVTAVAAATAATDSTVQLLTPRQHQAA